MKRVLIVVMLFFTIFPQYAGVPSQGFTPNVSFVYNETPVVVAATGLPTNSASNTGSPSPSQNIKNPEATSPPPNITTASPSPSQEVTLESPISEDPPTSPLPPPEITHKPGEGPVQSPPASEASPASSESEVIPTPTPSASEATPTPAVILGPLVDHLPTFNDQSNEYIVFQSDMLAIVNNAMKLSGIHSTYGLFIMDLRTELYYGINENLTQLDPTDNKPEGFFNSASTIKLFQGYIFCDMMRRGELDSEKTYFDKITGRKFKLLPMVKSMISYSDNNYSNACLRIVDNKKSNEVLSRLGITNSRLYGEMSGAIGYSRQNNIKVYGTDKRCARITPQDAGLILYNIYRNKYSDPYMRALNEGLLGNVYNSRIPVGVKRVSSKYYIAHKTGTNSSLGVYNDAGIIYTKNPFILVAFAQGTSSSIGHSFIRSLAEKLTRYFEEKLP